MLTIEVLGVSPRNKGALLMFEAIRSTVLAAFPAARLAVPFDWPVEQRLGYGLYCTNWQERGRLDASRLIEHLPQRWRKRLGFVSPREVDVVLDASGFGYGDHWGQRKLERRLVRIARHWKTERNTLILLPQALGPFDAPGMASAFREVLAQADRVHVRDGASLQHVRAVGGRQDRVCRAPDFTNLLQVELPQRLRALRGAALLVPNEKMVAGQGADRREAYLAFLHGCATQLGAAGHRVVLLVHEGEGDRQLARDVNARLPQPIEVVDEPSPLLTKAVIGAAHCAVSSRFHGLVSALSSAVPSAACGWTHKYGELMADYGCAELDIDLTRRDRWGQQIDLLVQAAAGDALRTQLALAAKRQRDASEAMWAGVFDLLHRQRAGAA